MRFQHRLALAVATFTCAAIVGCGGKPTGDLTGTVKYKGKAVVAGTVTVYDETKMVYQGGIDQGSYTVKNVPVGAVTIIVVSPNPNVSDVAAAEKERPGRESRPGDANAPPPIQGWFALPKKYEDANSTPLKSTVKQGPNPYDIELKD